MCRFLCHGSGKRSRPPPPRLRADRARAPPARWLRPGECFARPRDRRQAWCGQGPPETPRRQESHPGGDRPQRQRWRGPARIRSPRSTERCGRSSQRCRGVRPGARRWMRPREECPAGRWAPTLRRHAPAHPTCGRYGARKTPADRERCGVLASLQATGRGTAGPAAQSPTVTKSMSSSTRPSSDGSRSRYVVTRDRMRFQACAMSA